MATQAEIIDQEGIKDNHTNFQDILSDEALEALLIKHGAQDQRKRKLWVRCFFWLMVFSSSQPAHRGSLLQLVGFFLGAAFILFPDKKITTLSKMAVSKRLSNVSWYLFRGHIRKLKQNTRVILPFATSLETCPSSPPYQSYTEI